MKAAVYLSTRNRYEDLLPPAYSLIMHSNVDKIYFLIEDDDLPEHIKTANYIPPQIECINVQNQKWFNESSPNYNSSWSYMVLLRAALPKIFPSLDKIIQFDLDTIVNQDISDLWDIPIEDYYIAGVKEPNKSINNTLYINAGVSIWNLKKMREDGADNLLIDCLNQFYFPFPDQDAIYKIFQGKIKEIPSDYNINNYVSNYQQAKIYHFAYIKNYREYKLFNAYKGLQQEDVYYHPDREKGLDIIIPHYNNLKGLKKTLDSIYENTIPDIQITVVDDCSTVKLEQMYKKYPKVNFYKLEKNSGPGVARQYGIDHTNKEYILFIDAGDYSSIDALKIVREDIKNNIPCLYSYEWFNEEHQKKAYAGGTLLHGHVFKRSFLELYDIHFNAEASYSNEDRGFLYPCKLILKSLIQQLKMPLYKCREVCILNYEYNPNSLVHSNNYMFNRHIIGFCDNMTYMLQKCKNLVNTPLIVDELSKSLMSLYLDLMSCAKYHPEYYQMNFNRIRKYYFESIRQYIYVILPTIELYFSANVKAMLNLTSSIFPTPNLYKFLQSLEGEDSLVRFDNSNI